MKRLAEDGLPKEMFQDIKRASHRFLMASEGPEAEDYQARDATIRAWKKKKKIGSGKIQESVGPPRAAAGRKRWVSRGVQR